MLRSAPAALAFAMIASIPLTAQAAPKATPPQSPITEGLVVNVHGCHRHCTWGYVPRWGTTAYHRHRGPHCRPRPCGRRFDRPPPHAYGPACFKLGPVWYCP